MVLNKQFWTTTDVADLLRLSRQTVVSRYKRGGFPNAERVNEWQVHIIIPVKDVKVMLDKRIVQMEEELEKTRLILEELKSIEFA